VNAAGGRLQECISLSQRFGHEDALRNAASRIADAAEELVLRVMG
jgi:hypothetical protein